MSGGRPTKYSEEMLSKANDYLHNYAEKGDAVPIMAGLACELGVSKKTLYTWGELHEPFLHTLEAIQAAQERKLASGGLEGAFQPTIAKLMMANHGYSEKQEVKHSGGVNVSIDSDDAEL